MNSGPNRRLQARSDAAAVADLLVVCVSAAPTAIVWVTSGASQDCETARAASTLVTPCTSSSSIGMVVGLLLLYIPVVQFARVCARTGRGRPTIGSRLTSTIVVDRASGENIGSWRAAKRFFVLSVEATVPIVLVLGYLKRPRSLHDLAASCRPCSTSQERPSRRQMPDRIDDVGPGQFGH